MTKLKIKELCAAKGLTQKELAAMVEITTTSLSQIITGKQKPSLDTLEKIAAALCVGVADLFGDSVQASTAPHFVCPCCGKRIKVALCVDE